MALGPSRLVGRGVSLVTHTAGADDIPKRREEIEFLLVVVVVVVVHWKEGGLASRFT